MSKETSNTPADELALLALLYAGDFLGSDESACFEQLLEEAQEAREALAAAAGQLFAPVQAKANVKPSPAYRAGVRKHLRDQRTRQVRAKRVRRRDNAPLWAIVATAAAVLLVLGVSYFSVNLQYSWSINSAATRVSDLPFAQPVKLSSIRIKAPIREDGRLVGQAREAQPDNPVLIGDGPHAPRFIIIVFSDALVVIRYRDG
jgi:hypothetical protein